MALTFWFLCNEKHSMWRSRHIYYPNYTYTQKLIYKLISVVTNRVSRSTTFLFCFNEECRAHDTDMSFRCITDGSFRRRYTAIPNLIPPAASITFLPVRSILDNMMKWKQDSLGRRTPGKNLLCPPTHFRDVLLPVHGDLWSRIRNLRNAG